MPHYKFVNNEELVLDFIISGDLPLSTRGGRVSSSLDWSHTPSTVFRHLPPNSARFSYATEGALFISAQLSTGDAVSALRKVWVLLLLWKQPSAQAPT